ncbi:MAG TPA: hypothetical protein VHD90_28450 [Phototrophicaceae bacterium]|nr:hypothetical protein [Phototrophicaceae bacterium]
MYMIMYVAKSVDQATDVLNAWIKAGISGVTLLESAGIRQALSRGIRDDMGIMLSLNALLRSQEVHHRTLFSAVSDDATLDRVVKATTDSVGDWSKPDVGVLFVWPLTQAYGLEKRLTH